MVIALRAARGALATVPVLFPATERGVEPVENTQPFVDRSARGERTEPRLGIMLRHGDPMVWCDRR